MLDNKEVLKKFKDIMLSISDKADTFENYMNEVDKLISDVANKAGLYEELIHLWLNEKVELKEDDLVKVDNYLDMVRNKENYVNLLTAIVKGYTRVKFNLDDKFTHRFVKNIYTNGVHSALDFPDDDEDSRVIRISNEIQNNEPTKIREILFVMSYLYVEESYNDILKKLMVYKAK